MAHYERSTVSEVFDLLREFGEGAEITFKDVQERMPWIEPNHISASLGMLSQERYGALERLGKNGRVRLYRVTKKVYESRREHRKPSFARRYRDSAKDGRAARPIPSIKGSISDTLLDAAMLAETGGSEDAIIDRLRAVYLRIKHPEQSAKRGS